MTSTKQKIAIMQAFEDGKVVESSYKCQEWEDDPNPKWDWVYGSYRIKPEPMVVKMVCCSEGHPLWIWTGQVYHSDQHVRKFKEVIEE